MLRTKAIKYIDRLIFETHTIKEKFQKLYTGKKNFFLGINYTAYSNTNPSHNCIECRNSNSLFKIGLLGTVNTRRRNYRIVSQSLAHLSPQIRKKLHLVILGECPFGIKNKIIKDLRTYISVDCRDGIINEKEFTIKGTLCDILLAPLSGNMVYGTLKGSGAFGDAIYLRRKLIIPSFVDPEREFKDFCLYYNNPSELSKLLINATKSPKKTFSNSIFSKYKTQVVFSSLKKDLCLITQNKLRKKLKSKSI